MATGMAASLAAEAVPRTARDCNSASMTDHDDVVRVVLQPPGGPVLGTGFTVRAPTARRHVVERLEPLDPDLVALDVACGAGHAAEVVAAEYDWCWAST